MRRLALAVLSLALVLPGSAHAAVPVTMTVTPTTSYSACGKVTGPSSVFFTVTMTSDGVQSKGLSAAVLSATASGSGFGVAQACTIGGIVPTWGAVVYTLRYGTSKGSNGALVVECTTVNTIFACSPTSALSVAALD